MVGLDNRRMLDTIRRLNRRNSKITLYKYINKIHPSQMVYVYRHLHPTERINIFQYIIRMDGVGSFIKELDEILIKELFSSIDNQQISTILHKMDSEDIAELIEYLSESQSNRIQELLNTKELSEVEEFLKYEDESAGRIMSHEFMAFDSHLTVQNARDRFKDYGEDVDMPFYIYVINKETDKMVGITSLRQLLLSPSDSTLEQIMEKEFIFVSPDDDREKVANEMAEYNYLALPVLDSNNKLVGIVTVDDIIDVIREEATEDILKMAGAGDDEDILLKPAMENAKTRFPWLMASWVGGIFALLIISYFEKIMLDQIVLASFIPIIIGMGGNVGTQTSTIIVRGIATGHVNIDEFYKVIIKEIKVGFILGLIYGILLGILGTFITILSKSSILSLSINTSSIKLGLIVSLSIFSSMLIACTVASIIPMILYKIKLDPAISTGPFVTTAIDILGVLAYFSIATILL
ncbi:MAG: magnesium transporter [Candidatus Marinimicrobia bacterium]|nr:magnesium transporter [Candidatus Neomarinimicrobiota bacterium]|tara:strand:- start:1946 stop:3340 length:1395 start_codon:yes stop_codon:yes gene_type:complete